MLLLAKRTALLSLGVAAAFSLVACSSSSSTAQPQPGNTIAGFPLPTVGTAIGGGSAITIASDPRYTCAVGDEVFANTQQLFFNLGEAPVVGKSYSVQNGDGYALARFDAFNTSCTDATAVHGTQGTVAITSVDATSVEGNYDVTFDNGERIAATFTATICPTQVFSDAGCQ